MLVGRRGETPLRVLGGRRKDTPLRMLVREERGNTLDSVDQGEERKHT